MRFKTLNGKIEERGIKKTIIAKTLGVSERALRYKIEGESPLSWDQACAIQENFFPDIDLRNLFPEQVCDFAQEKHAS